MEGVLPSGSHLNHSRESRAFLPAQVRTGQGGQGEQRVWDRGVIPKVRGNEEERDWLQMKSLRQEPISELFQLGMALSRRGQGKAGRGGGGARENSPKVSTGKKLQQQRGKKTISPPPSASAERAPPRGQGGPPLGRVRLQRTRKWKQTALESDQALNSSFDI